MFVRQENSVWKSFWHSRWFAVAGLVLLVFLVLASVRAYYQNYQIHQEIKRLQNEGERLKKKKIQTLDMLHYFESPAYLEEKARGELNLMKSGEHVVILPGSPSSSRLTGQLSEKEVESSQLSIPRQWWNYFVGSNMIHN